MSTKTTALTVAPSEETMALINSQFPSEPGFQRTLFPRLGMVSQDKVEGKGKQMKVVTEAGMFFIEKSELGKDGKPKLDPDTGKAIWSRTELGSSIEAIIIFQRKQLRYYDENTEQFTSSPIYDLEDEVLPLFRDRAEIARGTPAELKAREEYQVVKAGKEKSALEDNRILYVIYEDELYQMTLRGSSMFSFMSFERKANPPANVLKLDSEPQEKGDIAWNKMTFTVVRPINKKEAEMVLERQNELKEAITQEKGFYAAKSDDQKKADKAYAEHESSTSVRKH